jgi:hypothetical protein
VLGATPALVQSQLDMAWVAMIELRCQFALLGINNALQCLGNILLWALLPYFFVTYEEDVT